MVKPATLACGHSGCQNCLATLVAMESVPKCPLCLKVFPSGTALNVNIVLDSITAKLDIQCTNSGCQWQGTLENHTQHSNTCAKLPVRCVNRGCSETMPREEMAQHISQCEKQEVPCQDCGRSVTRDSMREHVNSLCSHKRIPCPLSCGTNLPRYVFADVIYDIFHFVLCVFVVALSMEKERHLSRFAFWHVLLLSLAMLHA